MPKPVKGNGRYMAGIDGLRALAVLAVIAYHLNLGFAPGGLLGVGVFFVLSGYLITDLLIREWKRDGRFNMKDFWLRRARRLLPALLVMMVIVVAWMTVFNRDEVTALRGDVLAAMLYVSNWWFVFHHVSYFASFGPPSPLGHLWSLAVEEQFYLLWPLFLYLGLRFVPRRGRMVGLTLLAAAISSGLMALLYVPGTDPSRVYYGTDTRAFALLIGAALAMVWPSGKLSERVPAAGKFALDLLGSAGLTVIILMIWRTNQYDVSLYRGGLVFLCLVTATTVAVLAHPASHVGKVMGCSPLRWIGVRSYGIYLWHYPVIVLTSPAVDTTGMDVPRAVLQVVTSIVLAALSWRYIEEPIRQGAIQKLWAEVRGHKRKAPLRGGVIASGGALLTLGVFCLGMTAPISASTAAPVQEISPTQPVSTPLQTHNSPQDAGRQPSNDTGRTASSGSAPSTHVGAGGSNMPHDSSGSPSSNSVSGSAPAARADLRITAIGDSVLIDAAPYLKKLFPGIVIDAKVGRQMTEAPAVVAQLQSRGQLGSTVIIEMGTNGPFTKDQLESLLRSLGAPQQIILVNTRVPRPWESVVNTTLADVAASFPHTTLVDWYGASAGHNAFFSQDGVHLGVDGSRFYASLVARSVK